MRAGSRAQWLEQLKKELQSNAYQTLLTELRIEESFLRRFRTWAEVLLFMHGGDSHDPRKDSVLYPILKAHGEVPDQRWVTILLTVFWPGLDSIFKKRRRWDPLDPDRLWANTYSSFLHVVNRFDVELRSERLVQKIINDTHYHLRNECRRIWDRADREVSLECLDADDRNLAYKNKEFIAVDLARAQEQEVKRLSNLVRAGRLSQPDFFLLVGTTIYGQSIADFAQRTGIANETAKKRHQRAWRRSRPFEK